MYLFIACMVIGAILRLMSEGKISPLVAAALTCTVTVLVDVIARKKTKGNEQ